VAGDLGGEDRPVQLGEPVALDPHPELLHLRRRRGGGGVDGVESLEHFARVGHELSSGLGELDPSRASLEENDVELRLEAPDDAGERGLGDADAPRRAPEVRVL
jgi:hypothetical protein